MAGILILWSVIGILTGAGGSLFAHEPGQVMEHKPAQTVISLKQAIRLVKEGHPDIRLQKIAVEKAAHEVKLAARSFLPDVDVDYIVSSATGGWGLILTAAKLLRPVFSFGRLLAEKEVKEILQQKEALLIRYRELEAVQGVKELYAALLLQRELARILEDNKNRSMERFDLMKTHYAEGRLNGKELLREKLAYETARSEAGKAAAWLNRSEIAFEKLLGLPRGGIFSLEPLPLYPVMDFPLNLHECLITAYAKNPVIEALLMEEKADLKRLGIKAPVFHSDGAFLGLGDRAGGIFSGAPRFGFTGNLTLYDWGKARLRERILGLEHSGLVLRHEKELQALESAIINAYFELERLQNEIQESAVKSELAHESKRRGAILQAMGRRRQADHLSFENEYVLRQTEGFEKRLEYFIVRERLIKDLGFCSLDELKEVRVP